MSNRYAVFIPAALALGALFTFGTPRAVEAQCLKCTTTIGEELKCNVDQASSGYYTCSCPCECEGACNQLAQSVEFDDLDRGSIPQNGVGLTAVDEGIIQSGMEEVAIWGMLEGATALVGAEFGIVQFPDGEWRAFPLDAGGVMTVRACDGRFLGRTHQVVE